MSAIVALDFNIWYGQLFQLYQEGQFAEGLDRAIHEGAQYLTKNGPLVYHYRACMYACLGQDAEAIRTLAEAHDQGYWYGATFWDDADFKNINETPDFKAQRAISEAREAAAKANAKPLLTVLKPDQASTRPVLIALHGNNGNTINESDNWRPAVAQGWLVGLAQSSQIVGPESYVWNDTGIADTEIKQHHAVLLDQHSGDSAQVVLGGFSMGGETVIRQACTGLIPARGFIAVGPGGPLTGQTPDEWEPILKQGKERGVRGCLIIGKKDNGYEQIKELVERIKAAGIPLQVREYEDIGHVFPADFAANLPEMLNFVLGG